MKLRGEKLTPPKGKLFVIPREGEGEADLVFRLTPVMDRSDFEKRCPRPKPPLVMKPGFESQPNFDDKTYLARMNKQFRLQVAWTFIMTLRDTEGLEWEQVDLEDPDTWEKYEEELHSFLSVGEFTLLQNEILDLNSPSDTRMQEALERFRRTQAEGQDTPPQSPQDEHGFTKSGEPASESTSDPQESQKAGTN